VSATIRKIVSLAAIGALITAGAAFAVQFGFLDSWEELVRDRFFIRRAPPAEIVIVAIDDASIATIGQWPWPRREFAVLLERVRGARAVAIDVTFSEASRHGAADDRAFADAIVAFGQPIVLPVEINERSEVVLAPLPELSAAAAEGFADVLVDADGITRFVRTRLLGYESFALAAARQLGAAAGGDAAAADRLRIDYRGPARTFSTVSFHDAAAGRIPERAFADKLVLVGATASNLHDILATPFGRMPGVEVHANAIATLMDDRPFRAIPFGVAVGAFALANALAAGTVYAVRRLRVLVGLLAGFLSLIVAASFALFETQLTFPTVAAVLGFLGTAGSATALQYLAESREKRFIQKSFQHYLAPDVVRELIKDPAKLRLGGERRTVAILFSDIRGFTSLSETMDPEALAHLVNEYLTAMTDIVMARHGLVDKYIGDAIMALWGAPIERPDATQQACRAALAMVERLAELNEQWAREKLPRLDIGIGINAGAVFVGNIGSRERFNYTVIGDEVNFTSRLEGLNKIYGTRIIVSDAVRAAIADVPDLFVRELDRVMVKGKKEPRTIFELLPAKQPEGAAAEAFAAFARGRQHYAAGRWREAAAEFGRALELADDPPSRLFLERCRVLQQHPPDQWTGVFEFKSK